MPKVVKKKTSKEKILEISKELFDYIEEEDILRSTSGGKLVHNKLILTHEQKNAIIQGAKELLANETFIILAREMRYLCMKKICLDAQSNDESAILFGKAGLWFENIFTKKIASIARLK